MNYIRMPLIFKISELKFQVNQIKLICGYMSPNFELLQNINIITICQLFLILLI